MVIDAHLHLQDDVYVRDEGTPENLIRLMDKAGIQKSVVFKIWNTTRSSIEAGEEAARKYPDRLIPFAYAVPSYESAVISELEEALSKKGFRGIKIHTGDSRPVNYIIDPVVRLAGNYGVPCLIDFRGDHVAAHRLASSFPRTRLIIAHMGKFLCSEQDLMDRFIAIAEKCSNTFLDISGVIELWKIKDAVRRIGSHRILWGTDGPRAAPDPLSFVRLELNKIEALDLKKEEKEDILGRSIMRLLGQ
jgi:predicted TIM-barrel fold metal-dependent hydrolase